jgi:GTP cyclohydrolase II
MDEMTVQRLVCSRIPTRKGQFQLCLYTNNLDDKEHLALIMGEVADHSNVLVRIHSECFTGDVLASQRCDCGEQLEKAMEAIAIEGVGVIVYLRQEGRGIGLESKLRAYNLQDQGYDTVDANLALGHPVDPRDYTVAALILKDLGVQSVRLLTNNMEKIRFLEEVGIRVVDRIPSVPTVTSENARYLRTKALRMNHLLNIPALLPLALDRKHGAD